MTLEQVRDFDVAECLHRMAASVGWRLGPLNPPEPFPMIGAEAYLWMDRDCEAYRRLVEHYRGLRVTGLGLEAITWKEAEWDWEAQGWAHRIVVGGPKPGKRIIPVDWNLVRVTRMTLAVEWVDLDNPGRSMADPNANAALVSSLWSAVWSGGGALDTVPTLLKSVLKEDAWKVFGKPLGELIVHKRFEEFVAAREPKGLGASVDLIRRAFAWLPKYRY